MEELAAVARKKFCIVFRAREGPERTLTTAHERETILKRPVAKGMGDVRNHGTIQANCKRKARRK